MINIVFKKDYIKILQDNDYHFQNLLDIIDKNENIVKENCLYKNLFTTRCEEILNKQQNLYSIAKSGNKILEIGFNTGYLALLFLLLNPEAQLVCFDICLHGYTQLCFEYLCDNFKGRIKLFCGNFIDTIPAFINANPGETFDILHIDSFYDSSISNIDFLPCFELVSNNSIIIWNNVNLLHLKKFIQNTEIKHGWKFNFNGVNFLQLENMININVDLVKEEFTQILCSIDKNISEFREEKKDVNKDKVGVQKYIPKFSVHPPRLRKTYRVRCMLCNDIAHSYEKESITTICMECKAQQSVINNI